MGIIFGCMSPLVGENEKVAPQNIKSASTVLQNEFAGTELSSDIERPLLRPVTLEKEDAVTNDQKTAESVSNPKIEQCIENIMSILQAERKKLQELENEYKKIKKDVMEEDSIESSEIDVKEEIESKSTSAGTDELQLNKKFEKNGTSSTLAEAHSLKNESMKNGSSTGHLRIVKDDKKMEMSLNNELNQRLSKVIGNVSALDLAECFYKLCEYDNALQTYKLLTSDNISSDQYIWVQYQIANCYRNMKKFDIALSEYQRFINQYPGSDLIEQAKWYLEDVNWWKTWHEKNALAGNQLFAISSGFESK